MFSIDVDALSITYQDTRVAGALNFDSQAGLANLAADKGWNKEWLTELWNDFAGVVPFDELRVQKCFKNRDYAVARIWNAIQRLASGNGHASLVVSASDSVAPATAEMGAVGAQAAPVATEAPETGGTASPAEEAPLSADPVGDGKQIEDLIVVPKRKRGKKTAVKQPKAAKAPKPAKAKMERTARDGSKKAEVIRLLQRKNGASIAEIQAATGWAAHSARGFCFGSCKKAGLIVTSEKPEGSKIRRYYLPA
jgi:hypothetical protein